jgi:hypothetical protein
MSRSPTSAEAELKFSIRVLADPVYRLQQISWGFPSFVLGESVRRAQVRSRHSLAAHPASNQPTNTATRCIGLAPRLPMLVVAEFVGALAAMQLMAWLLEPERTRN